MHRFTVRGAKRCGHICTAGNLRCVMLQHHGGSRLHANSSSLAVAVTAALLGCTPVIALAQAASPFMTGATALQTNILAWLTPIAVILVMALGAMAMANRVSWAWCCAAIIGIAIAFGAPQIVAWVRGMFGV